MLAINRPSESEYRSVRNYLESYKPLHNTEMDYIQHKEDLITLRPGRDHAWLDRSIDKSLHILDKPFPFLTVRMPCEAALNIRVSTLLTLSTASFPLSSSLNSPGSHDRYTNSICRKTLSNPAPITRHTSPAHVLISAQAR